MWAGRKRSTKGSKMRACPTPICTLMIVFGLQSAWAAPIPLGTAVLSKDATAAFKLAGSQQQLGKLEVIGVPDQSFTRALRIITAPGATAEWNVQLAAPTIANVKTGDVLLGHFWLRCADSMTGEGLISFEFESSQPDFTKAAELRVSASSQWKECFL